MDDSREATTAGELQDTSVQMKTVPEIAEEPAKKKSEDNQDMILVSKTDHEQEAATVREPGGTSVEVKEPKANEEVKIKAHDNLSVLETDHNEGAATASEQGDTSVKVKEPEVDEEKAKSMIFVMKTLFDISSEFANDPKNIARRENTLAKNYSKGFPTPIIMDDLFSKQAYYSAVKKKEYNWAILAFGAENFFSYAAYFCKYEVRNDATEIISIGSGNGTVDDSIIQAYYSHFGSKLNITLVDKNPDFKVDFKTVDDLLEKRPNVVRNCVLFILWPEPPGRNNNYDIEAIRKLQPTAALTACELSEISGSYDFIRFLRGKDKHSEGWYDKDGRNFGLDNYTVEEVARQEIYLCSGYKQTIFGTEYVTEPASRSQSLRLFKVKRID